MEDRLESEQRVGGTSQEVEQPSGQAPDVQGEEFDNITKEVSPEVKLLISRCLDGSEPLDRPLKEWEPDKLSTRALQAVLLRAGGFKNKDVARLMDLDPATVSVFVGHPYGKKIIAAMMVHQSVKVLDIKSKLEFYAHEMLDHTFGLAMQDQDLNNVQKVTFSLLDRAGYGPKSTIEHETKESASLANNSHLLSRIGDALSESKAVERVSRGFKQQAPPSDVPTGTASRDPDARTSGAEEHRSSSPPAGLQIPRDGTNG